MRESRENSATACAVAEREFQVLNGAPTMSLYLCARAHAPATCCKNIALSTLLVLFESFTHLVREAPLLDQVAAGPPPCERICCILVLLENTQLGNRGCARLLVSK